MIVSAQLARPVRLRPHPFRLDAFATAFVSVRIGARAAVLPTPRPAAQESAFSALAFGDIGPPSATADGRAARSYDETSFNDVEEQDPALSAGFCLPQIGVKA